jgi:hypothetical protein
LNSLLATIDPARKPYHLKIVQSEFDENDPCPVFDFHIAVKPLRSVVQENLVCEGHMLPPTEITITDKTTKVDVPCAFSDEMIIANGDSENGNMYYDIRIDLPHSDFFFDLEMKTDFLTGNFRMQLFTLDEVNNKWQKIAASYWFDENSYEDVNIDAEA